MEDRVGVVDPGRVDVDLIAGARVALRRWLIVDLVLVGEQHSGVLA